jgi:hypothetical protein
MMKLDPVLLNMACSWSMKAYQENYVKDCIRVETKWTSTTALIAKRKTIDVIAFKGTEDGLDWLTDALVIPVPYAGRMCHGGFTLAHRSIWKKILKHINFNKRTLITGHSLGGALAELSAAKLWKKHDNLNIITFGKPNTFFKGFKQPMTTLDNQISCVQGSDLVARIPKFCYGPSRSQTMLYFANSGVDFVDPDKLTRDEDRGIKDALSDHFMEGYKDRLAEFLLHQDNKPSKEDIKELNELADEVENA